MKFAWRWNLGPLPKILPSHAMRIRPILRPCAKLPLLAEWDRYIPKWQEKRSVSQSTKNPLPVSYSGFIYFSTMYQATLAQAPNLDPPKVYLWVSFWELLLTKVYHRFLWCRLRRRLLLDLLRA